MNRPRTRQQQHIVQILGARPPYGAPIRAAFMANANPAAVLALLDAAEERDEIAGRLAQLLCDLTGGRLSKTTYPVPVMVQEIEQYLSECHESDLMDERDALAAELAHMTEARDNARARVAELEAAIERVRELAEAWRLSGFDKAYDFSFDLFRVLDGGDR